MMKELAKEIFERILATQEEWVDIFDENVGRAIERELEGYQGSGFLDNWILDGILSEEFADKIEGIEDLDELELEIRNCAIAWGNDDTRIQGIKEMWDINPDKAKEMVTDLLKYRGWNGYIENVLEYVVGMDTEQTMTAIRDFEGR